MEVIKLNDPKVVDEQNKISQELFKEIWKGKDFEMKDAIKAIFFMMFKVQNTVETSNKKLATIETKLEGLENKLREVDKSTKANGDKISELQLRINELECEQHKNQIIIRKFPLHASVNTGGKETNEQTVEQIKDLFQDMDLTFGDKDFPEVFRVPTKSTQNKRKTIPNIFVKFPNFLALTKFYKNISNLQDSTEYKDIRVDKFVPQSMLDDYNNAQAKAFELRNQTPKKKTFIKLYKGKVILSYKSPSGSTWKECSYEPTITTEEQDTAGNASKKRKNPTD